MLNKVKFENFNTFYQTVSPIDRFPALKTKNIELEGIKSEDVVTIVECSISLILNDTQHIGIICTPQQIEELIVGHLICEGYIKSLNSLEKVIYTNNNEFKVYIHEEITIQPSDTEIRTAGMVGIKSKLNKADSIVESDLQISPKVFFNAQEQLTKKSVIWPVSGGAHMSSLHRSDGELCHFAEDVGRHNTIDKIIGSALLNGEKMSQLFSCTSGRVSSASIIKYIRGGIPILISVSAPTSEGIKMAQTYGMTVIGFSRKPSFTIYSHPDRVNT
jgi:FdhD protein